MSRTPPAPSSSPAAMQAAAIGAVPPAGKDVVPRFDLERAQLRMRTIETAVLFRRENTPVETLLENAEKLFSWVIEAPAPVAAPAARLGAKPSGDPS